MERRASKSLSPRLAAQADHIEELARGAGLDFFPVVFEMLDAKDVNAVAAYGGFPVRYPSWRFGMEYERLEKGRVWGLSKIYELVINNDPVYAYLVRSNSAMEQKLVMAHVFGHADFFKHNLWFAPTDRNMLDIAASQATRVRRYIDALGQDTVETFLDLALSLDSLVDPYLPLRERLHGKPAQRGESLSERARRSFEAASAASRPPAPRPPQATLPTFDVLGYLAEHAPLEDWQRDIVRMVRREAYYFVPQRMTKIMNEGWASYWHSRLLTGGILDHTEIVDFADCHSGATQAAPGQLNAYKLGIELFRCAEARGLDLFRLRRVHNDTSFIDELVDEAFARENQLFVFGRNARTGRTEVVDRDWRQVKQRLLLELTWGGLPQIELVDADHHGRRELLLAHRHDGRDLQLDVAAECLRRIQSLWRAPVHLTTLTEGQGRRLVADADGVRSVETKAADGAKPPEGPKTKEQAS